VPRVKTSFVAALLLAAVTVARADAPKPAGPTAKLPASARVFVIDKDAPATEKTEPLPRSRPALKQK
jgi:hypothetical protein